MIKEEAKEEAAAAQAAAAAAAAANQKGKLGGFDWGARKRDQKEEEMKQRVETKGDASPPGYFEGATEEEKGAESKGDEGEMNLNQELTETKSGEVGASVTSETHDGAGEAKKDEESDTRRNVNAPEEEAAQAKRKTIFNPQSDSSSSDSSS